MSGKLMGEVYNLILPKSERELLLALCDHADDSGEKCFPSINHLAWKLNCSTRNIQVLLRHLESKGLIVPISNIGGGRGKPTEYKIVLDSGEQRPEKAERPTKSKYKTPHGYTLEKFGITEDQYQQLYELQRGLCAICQRESIDKRLAVDHDHQTGKVRGLLCSKCNTAIGLLRDDAELLSRATEYLKGAKGEETQKGENPEKGEENELKGEEKRVKRVQEKGEKGAKTCIAYKEEPPIEPPIEPPGEPPIPYVGAAPETGQNGKPEKPPKPETFGKLKATAEEKQAIEQCFDFWVDLDLRKNAKLIPDSDRWNATLLRLREGYTVEQIQSAIRGIKFSPHHQGQNDRGMKYDDLYHVCKSSKNLENFIDLENRAMAPAAVSQLSSLGQQNLARAQRLIERKFGDG